MTNKTQVLFRVHEQPKELNYEILGHNGRVLFRTSRSKLERFVKDLRKKQKCSLKGNRGEILTITEGKNNPVRQQMAEYLELILEEKKK